MAAGVKVLKEERYYSWGNRPEKPLRGCGHDYDTTTLTLTVAKHRGEPCHAAAIELNGNVIYVCREPARHIGADPKVAREQERQRQEREEARLSREAAKRRREAIATVLAAANTSHLPIAASQVLAGWRVDESKLSLVGGSWGGVSARRRRHLELLVRAGYEPSEADRKHLEEADEEEVDEVLTCRVCGCTDEAACEGGCEWVEDPAGIGDLCSSCLPDVIEQAARRYRTGTGGGRVSGTTSARRGGPRALIEWHCREQRSNPVGDALANRIWAQGVRVEGRLDVGPQPGGEPLVLVDELLTRRAAPTRAAPQSVGQEAIRAVEVAEVDWAHQPTGGQPLELVGQHRAAQHGGPTVQGDCVGELQPGVAERVPAEGRDAQDQVAVEYLAVGQLAAHGLDDGGLACPAGPGHHEQRVGRKRLFGAAGRASEQMRSRVRVQLRGRATLHAEDRRRWPRVGIHRATIAWPWPAPARCWCVGRPQRCAR